MVLLLSVVTSLAGVALAWFSRGYEVVLRLAEDEAPAILQEWLQFAWRDPQLPFWCGGFLGSVALAFLHLEKRIVALVLALIGATIVTSSDSWRAIRSSTAMPGAFTPSSLLSNILMPDIPFKRAVRSVRPYRG